MPAIVKKAKRNNKKTAAFRNKYSPIGLDLGSAMIKMIQLHNQRGKLSVAKGFIGRTPEGAFENGEPVKPDLLARKIRAVINNKGWHGRNINLSLNPRTFSFRTVRLPLMDSSALSKAMYWEAMQSFPQNEEEIIFDYCLLNRCSENKDKARDYILAATSKSTAESYTSILDLAGLKCQALEVEPLSLFRSFNALHCGQLSPSKQNPAIISSRSKPAVLIYIGFNNSTVLITGKDELLFYRSIKLGTSNFIHILQEKYNCSTRDAEKFLFCSTTTAAQKLLVPTCKQLAKKIEQTLNTWLDQDGQAEPVPQQLHFCGGGAFIPGLRALIEKHLQIKQSLYNPLLNICQTDRENSNHQNREDIFFPVAHGLTLRGWVF